MARYSFGGGAPDYVMDRSSGRPVAVATVVTLWTAETGGTQVTDLLVNGAAATSLTTGAGGRLPVFEGPDGVFALWAQADGSVERARIEAYGDFGSLLPKAEASATYAKLPGAVRNTLTGWFHADGYGAKLDGVTNDAPALQAACDAAEAAGGGTVYLPPGDYVLGLPDQATATVFLGSRVVLAGAGRASRLVRASGGHSSPLVWNKGRQAANGGTGEGNTGISVRDITFDGTKGATTAYTSNEQGLWLSQANDSTVTRCHFLDNRTNGLVLENCLDVAVSDCHAAGNLKNGYYLTGSDRVGLTNCHGRNNGSSNVAGTFQIAASWYCTLTGCSGDADVGVSLLTGRDTRFLTVSGGFFRGVDVSPEAISSGTLFHQDNHPGAPTSYDSTVKYGMYDSVMTGVTVRTQGTTFQGIRILESDRNLIQGCVVRHVARNGIQVFGGNDNIIRNNKISNCGTSGTAGQQLGLQVIDNNSPNRPARNNWLDGNIVTDDQATSTTRGINVSESVAGQVSGTKLHRNRVLVATAPLFLTSGLEVEQVDNVITTADARPSVAFGTAAPTTGTWKVGDRVEHTAPAASGFIGFVCVTAGSPGTWKTYGAISA